jgi:hypothetical protein
MMMPRPTIGLMKYLSSIKIYLGIYFLSKYWNVNPHAKEIP